MAVGAIGQAAVTPVSVTSPGTSGARDKAAGGAAGVGAGNAQLAAQQIASNGGGGSGGGGAAPRTGAQPLNATGRGRIVNLIV